jgi:nucleotide-binding universal stress UspA family protein
MAKASSFRHIMVVTDGSKESFRAADCAINLARSLDAKLTALAVVDTETLRQLVSVKILVDAEMGELEHELEDSAKRQLDEVRDRAMDRRVTVEEARVAGNMEAVVPREVEQRQVDLIVLGGYDSSRAMRDLVCRQRQQIVDRAACPVLVVK